MKFFSGLILFFSLASLSFADGAYTSNDGDFIVSNVSVDGEVMFESVTLNLDLDSGTFSIVSAKEKAPTVLPETPIQTIDTENGYSISLLGCKKTGEIKDSSFDKNTVGVNCDIQVTNNSEDAFITVFSAYPGSTNASTSIKDNFSKLYLSESVLSGDEESGYGIELFMAKDQSEKFSFLFYVNPHATSISRLSIGSKRINFDDIYTRFENISF